MKFAVIAAFLQGFAFAATTYPVSATSVNCRSGPGTGNSVKKTYAKGFKVQIKCQTTGTSVEGNNIWDKTQDGCYVADKYIKTGKDGFVTTKCPASGGGSSGGGSSGGKVPGPVVNDYPYNGKCGTRVADPWNWYRCQCVSFVGWRVNKRLGIKFTNRYKGKVWGNANEWYGAAKAAGVTVNNTPKPGCIAQHSRNKWGHVAWVYAVNGNKVSIEEYNHAAPDKYSKRTVDKSEFRYIHLK